MMNSTPINRGTCMVDGRECTLSHVLIRIGDPQSPRGATQYHEIGYWTQDVFGRCVEVIDSHMDSDSAATLFRLLSDRKVTIDTRIRLVYNESRCSICNGAFASCFGECAV